MVNFIIIIILESAFLPVESESYGIIDELRVRGIQLERFMSNLPYKISEFSENRDEYIESGRSEYDKEDCSIEMLIHRLDYLDIPKSRARVYSIGRGLSDTVSRYFQEAGFFASLSDIDICIQPLVKFGESSEYPTYRWYDGVGVDLRRSYGCAEVGKFDILLGREALRWGPPSGNMLILSGASPSFDLLYISYANDFFKGTFFVTSLGQYTLQDTLELWWRNETFIKGTRINMFLSGHRLDLSFFDNRFLIGLSEVVIYSGEGISLISGYLNPLNLYYRYRLNRGDRNYSDNVGIGFDFSYYMKDGLCFYGQIFVDDAKFERDEYNNPSILGYCSGLKSSVGRSFWTLRYTRVDTWTYIHQLYWNDYLFLGYPIGHPKGQDFDEINGRFIYHLNYNWDVGLDLCYTRKGENSFESRWPGVFPEHQNFPSGVVERSFSTEVSVSFFNLQGLFAKFTLGYTTIRGYQHTEDRKRSFPSFGIVWNSLIF